MKGTLRIYRKMQNLNLENVKNLQKNAKPEFPKTEIVKKTFRNQLKSVKTRYEISTRFDTQL